MTWEDYLEEIYHNPAHPASFSGPKKLYDQVKKEGKFKIGLRRIKNWLGKQDAYTLQRSVIRKFKRQRVITSGMNRQFDSDIGFLLRYEKDNDGFKYFLLCIDVFSRFIYTRALKTKNGDEVGENLNSIFSELPKKPDVIRTDKGTEFLNKKVQKLFRENDIKHFTTENELKGNYAERAIKTIKSKLIRYMTDKNTFRWVDILQSVTKSYNETKHRSIGVAPAEVTSENEAALWGKIYPDLDNTKPKKRVRKSIKHLPVKKARKKLRAISTFKFKLDDQVRISHTRRAFQKEYDERWTREHFIITDRYFKGDIPVYKLKDFDNDPISGTFYENELQRVFIDEHYQYKIEEVLRRRTRRGQKEMLVKYLGWPSKFNAWIPVENIVDL